MWVVVVGQWHMLRRFSFVCGRCITFPYNMLRAYIITCKYSFIQVGCVFLLVKFNWFLYHLGQKCNTHDNIFESTTSITTTTAIKLVCVGGGEWGVLVVDGEKGFGEREKVLG